MDNERRRGRLTMSFLLIAAVLVSTLMLPGQMRGQTVLGQEQGDTAQTWVVRVPMVYRNLEWTAPFGVEWTPNPSLTNTLAQRTSALAARPVRLHRVSWRAVQPNEGDAYNWAALADFENELRAAKQAGLLPVPIIHHSPTWATINQPYVTDCGAIRADKLSAFASFLSALVRRYSTPEFNVHHWELFNEPDVDPSLVPAHEVYGCWGDIDDPYYGGRQYGEMLKVAGAAIKGADPTAKVISGGLLLYRPVPQANEGHPERFLEGILLAGAAPYFDIVAYHAYASWIGEPLDHDLFASPFVDWGGGTIGKARFFRQVMAAYGVSKPLFLNETALACNPEFHGCNPAPPEFFEAQANHLVRAFTRGWSERLWGFIWYTLDGPGWRDVGLLDGAQNPRPAYYAFQVLASQLNRSHFEQKVSYGSDVEGYSFLREHDRVHVIWSVDTTADVINVPQADFVAAYDRMGNVLSPSIADPYYQFAVGFSPIYVVLRR